MTEQVTDFAGGCKIVKLKVVEQDNITLIINQHDQSIGKDFFPYSVRDYRIQNFAKNGKASNRGGHVHHNDNRELMFWMYGSPMKVLLHSTEGCIEFELSNLHEGLYVPPEVHHTVLLPPQTGLLVIASENYDHASETTDRPCQCKF